jgi:hypothetical protein
MNVSYYLNFVEEKRISMDEYGSELINYQKKNFPQLKVNEFKPKLSPLSKLIFNFKLKMRYSRYISWHRPWPSFLFDYRTRHDLAFNRIEARRTAGLSGRSRWHL